MKPVHLPTLLLPVLALACAGEQDRSGTAQAVAIAQATAEPEMLTYAPDLKIDVTAMRRRPSGLLLQDLEAGAGDTAATGSQVVVRYTGWLPDGTEFDGNRAGEPFVFRIGAGEVIQGWDEGLIGMRPGGKRKLILPPRLAYGEEGSGPIPPYATLVFEVELLELRP